MNVFLDTNIVIDYIFEREKFFEPAAKVIARSLQELDMIYTSVLTFVTTLYVSKQYDKSAEQTKDSLKRLVKFINVVDLTGENVIDNLSKDWKDYEDSTQYSCAIDCNADVILTRNRNDFRKSNIPVMTPQEYLLSL